MSSWIVLQEDHWLHIYLRERHWSMHNSPISTHSYMMIFQVMITAKVFHSQFCQQEAKGHQCVATGGSFNNGALEEATKQWDDWMRVGISGVSRKTIFSFSTRPSVESEMALPVCPHVWCNNNKNVVVESSTITSLLQWFANLTRAALISGVFLVKQR